jgi:hypothetical protein
MSNNGKTQPDINTIRPVINKLFGSGIMYKNWTSQNWETFYIILQAHAEFQPSDFFIWRAIAISFADF